MEFAVALPVYVVIDVASGLIHVLLVGLISTGAVVGEVDSQGAFAKVTGSIEPLATFVEDPVDV